MSTIRRFTDNTLNSTVLGSSKLKAGFALRWNVPSGSRLETLKWLLWRDLACMVEFCPVILLLGPVKVLRGPVVTMLTVKLYRSVCMLGI